MTVNEETFGLELSVGQKKKFEDVALNSGKFLRRAFFTTFAQLTNSQTQHSLMLRLHRFRHKYG